MTIENIDSFYYNYSFRNMTCTLRINLLLKIIFENKLYIIHIILLINTY